ncbi:MAG: hypothetical protein KDD39_08110, partial [Bdellovibrionales bacterium]|nr:hypothetical protein [Bdellovibrionales bacterium]
AVVFATLSNGKPSYFRKKALSSQLTLVDSVGPLAKAINGSPKDVLGPFLFSRFPAFGEIAVSLLPERENSPSVEEILGSIIFAGFHAQMSYAAGAKGYRDQVMANFRTRTLSFGAFRITKKLPGETLGEWVSAPFFTGPNPHSIRCAFRPTAPHAFLLPTPDGMASEHEVSVLYVDGVPVGGAYRISAETAANIEALAEGYNEVMGRKLFYNGTVHRAAIQNAFIEIAPERGEN